jgi:hypothetical protein
MVDQPKEPIKQNVGLNPVDTVSNFINGLRPSVIKQRWGIVKSNPAVSVNFQAKAYKMLFYLISVIIAYQFIKVIISFNAGDPTYTQIGRAFTIFVAVIIIHQIYTRFYKPMQQLADHYKKLPPPPSSNLDVRKAVDDTFKYFEDKKK